jgi:SpoVK/Ycf46/Vps4 family AAA+-type ATPase
LFYGPPGTGKTITATLLAKYTGKEVFRIDLSMVVSKYIGETEKNLSTLFDKAENKDWILFFDEADAIFGKRTGVRDAHDKYANQEVSYLLQRIESYNGLVILASNFRNNIDTAFIRRFNAIIYFPAPKAEDRLALWEKSLPSQLKLSKENGLREIAEKYELTGSHIINIVQYLSLTALESRDFVLTKDMMIKGIRREMEKEGK